MKYGSIYYIKNLINNKMYIGQTIFNVEDRWKKHLNRYNKDSAISKALDKYGEQNFEFKELCSCLAKDELNDKEKYFIKYYDTTGKNGYNKTFGGTSPIFTKEVRQKMSIAKLGKPGNRKSQANQNGSNTSKKVLHVQRLEGETMKIEYNPSTSSRQPSKYEQFKEQIISLYESGLSTNKVASKLDLDKSMICSYLKKWNKLKTIKEAHRQKMVNRYKLSPEFISQVHDLYNYTKLSQSGVASYLKVSVKTVIRALKAEDIVRSSWKHKEVGDKEPLR